MLYTTLLAIHSLLRWFVLISLLYAIYRAYKGRFGNQSFSKQDNTARAVAAAMAHAQLILGVALYLVSPLVDYFLHNFKEAVHDREIRFYGMEHNLMMLVAIVLLTIGSALTKRKTNDQQKFKTMAIWYTIALLIILTSIPWSFSPLASRPLFRL